MAVKKKQSKTKLYIIIAAFAIVSIVAFLFVKQKRSNTAFIKTVPTEKTTKDQNIDYFLQMALFDSVNKKENPLFRWDHTPVKIGVHDVTLPGDKPFASTKDTAACLERIISDFNNISKDVKLKQTYWFPEDIAIAIVNREKILDYVKAYSQLGQAEYVIHLKEAAGFVEFGIGPDYAMGFTLLVAAPDAVEKREECALLYHEMMHAFGFPNHNTSRQDPTGVLTDGKTQFEGFSNRDKMLIQTLYNTDIPTGINVKEAKEFLFSKND